MDNGGLFGRRKMLRILVAILAVFLLGATYKEAEGWFYTKQVLYDVIYRGHEFTLYHGCKYRWDRQENRNKVDLSSCSYEPVEKQKNLATRLDAEHIVPASLFPARQFPCWVNGSRSVCEKTDPRAQAMIYDLHNLAPAIGQVNVLRSNKRYGYGPKDFEPQNCIKGDVARVWLYAHERHGVVLLPGEKEMFERWSQMDPVSPWESEREKRIRKYTFVANPFVRGVVPDIKGACPWELSTGSF